MATRPQLCLVCYDIADPKRLLRVHRHLREVGLPVQYSVFTLRLTPRRQAVLLRQLRTLIDEREDDVRMYPLPDNGERIYLGKQLFPEDVWLIGSGGNLLLSGHRQA